MTGYTDEELLALYRDEASRHHAFHLIVKHHQQRLHAFIRRMVTDPDEAKDVLQDVFIKAWHGLDRFRADAELSSWLHRIAYNAAVSHIKRARRGLFVDLSAAYQRSVATLDDGAHFDGDEIQRRLQRAVMRLPAKQRAVFTMKYFQELKYEEISAITGTSVGALKSTFHIAVKKVEEWVTSDRTN